MADPRSEIGKVLGREYLARIIGQGDLTPIVGAMDNWLDARAAEPGRRVDVSTWARKATVGTPGSSVDGTVAMTAP